MADVQKIVNKILAGSDIRSALLEDNDVDVQSKANVIEMLIDPCLRLLGLTVKNAHLSDKYDEFRKKFENILNKEGLDLSYLSAVTPKYGIKIGGNAGGIASDVAYHLWNNPWVEVKMSKQEIIDYLKKHSKAKCYSEYKKPFMNAYGIGGSSYSGVREVDKDKIINSEYGTTTNNVGIGSQFSVHVNKVSLKKDKLGNLLLTRSTDILD